jgi:pyruvate kinase
VIATTDRDDTARRLTPYWGVFPVCTTIPEHLEAAGPLIARDLLGRRLIAAGEPVVFVSISADLTRTDANYLKLQQV